MSFEKNLPSGALRKGLSVGSVLISPENSEFGVGRKLFKKTSCGLEALCVHFPTAGVCITPN